MPELNETDFSFEPPYGSDGTAIKKKGKNRFEIELGTEPGHPEWRSKLQFTIKNNAKGNRLHLDVNFDYDRDKEMKYNGYFLSWSYDQVNWRPIHWTYADDRDGWNNPHNIIFPEFSEDTVYVGAQVPFTIETIQRLLKEWEQSPFVSVNILGQSVRGRDVYRLTITDSDVPDGSKRAHYFKNEHGTEGNARWRISGMVDWLLTDEAAEFRKENVCYFVILSNPDGPAYGWGRANAEGIDQNRTFLPDTPDPEHMTKEQYFCFTDVKAIMKSDIPLSTYWSFHTWQGPCELVILPAREFTDTWHELQNFILALDTKGLIEQMHNFIPKFQKETMWDEGMHRHYGITTILAEGGTTAFIQEQSQETGMILIKALSEYYKLIM